jgi:hypothetical protein
MEHNGVAGMKQSMRYRRPDISAASDQNNCWHKAIIAHLENSHQLSAVSYQEKRDC